MFRSFFGGLRQYKALGNIQWVHSQTERYFQMPVDQVKAEAEKVSQLAKDAEKIGQYVQQIYKGYEVIQIEKDKANAQGVKSLTSVQKSRAQLDSLTQQLLEAAKH